MDGKILPSPAGGGAISGINQAIDSFFKLAEVLPQEGVLKVISIAGEIVQTNAEIRKKNQALWNELELLREKNAGVRERLDWLKELLFSDALPEPAKMKLVDAICELVVK